MKHTFGGPWTQIKLDLLGRYLASFNQALQHRPMPSQPFKRIYIDAFAGTGECEIKTDEQVVETIEGSAKIALQTSPAFDQIHLIDLNQAHVHELTMLAAGYGNRVRVHHDDANLAINKILRTLNWDQCRGVLFLDPYGMTVPWTTLQKIAATEALDVWYLFPLSGVYRQAAKDFEKVDQSKSNSLDEVLGTPTWRDHFYKADGQAGLLGEREGKIRVATPEDIAGFVHRRLAEVFKGWVSDPLYLRSPNGAPLFALFCCISNPAPKAVGLAKKIASHILGKFGSVSKRGSRKSSKPSQNLPLF
ncbi:MAG: three-Cys-motif partner protein TcmP [Janthinobacterium lividum]